MKPALILLVVSLLAGGCASVRRTTTPYRAPIVPPDTYVRVTISSLLWGRIVQGSVVSMDTDTLRVRLDYPAPDLSIPRNEIVLLERSRKTEKAIADGASLGVFLGGIGGGLAGYWAWKQDDTFPYRDKQGTVISWGGIGAIGAGLLGAIIGSGMEFRVWEEVTARVETTGPGYLGLSVEF